MTAAGDPLYAAPEMVGQRILLGEPHRQGRAAEEDIPVGEGHRIEYRGRLRVFHFARFLRRPGDAVRPPDAPGHLAGMDRVACFGSGPVFGNHRVIVEFGDVVGIGCEIQHQAQHLAVRRQAQHRAVHLAGAFPAEIVAARQHHGLPAIYVGVDPDRAGRLGDHVEAENVREQRDRAGAFMFVDIGIGQNVLPAEDLDALGHARHLFIGVKRRGMAHVHKGFQA